MSVVAPPPVAPQIAVYDNGDLHRFRERLFQIMASVVTVLVTGWICTFGAIPAILALMVAKHILVAILIWALKIDSIENRR